MTTIENAYTDINREVSTSCEFDYFFTTRKTVKTKTSLDKDLKRKTIKEEQINNYLVLDLPFNKFNGEKINIEIWGDKGYFYRGEIKENNGDFPLFSLRLKKDSLIFVKITVTNEENIIENYINFITISKRYQS